MRNGVVILRSYVNVRQVLAYHGWLPRVRATEQNPMQICWKHSRDARRVLTRYLSVRYVRRQIDLPSLPSCQRPRKLATKCHYGNAIYRARKDGSMIDDDWSGLASTRCIRVRLPFCPFVRRAHFPLVNPGKRKMEIFMRLFCRRWIMRFWVACTAIRAS